MPKDFGAEISLLKPMRASINLVEASGTNFQSYYCLGSPKRTVSLTKYRTKSKYSSLAKVDYQEGLKLVLQLFSCTLTTKVR